MHSIFCFTDYKSILVKKKICCICILLMFYVEDTDRFLQIYICVRLTMLLLLKVKI